MKHYDTPQMISGEAARGLRMALGISQREVANQYKPPGLRRAFKQHELGIFENHGWVHLAPFLDAIRAAYDVEGKDGPDFFQHERAAWAAQYGVPVTAPAPPSAPPPVPAAKPAPPAPEETVPDDGPKPEPEPRNRKPGLRERLRRRGG